MKGDRFRADDRGHTRPRGSANRRSATEHFERAGEASVGQTDSPADNKAVPTQLARSERQRATRTTPKSRGTAVGYIRVSTEGPGPGVFPRCPARRDPGVLRKERVPTRPGSMRTRGSVLTPTRSQSVLS